MKWIPPFGAQSENERYKNAAPTIPGSNPNAEFFNTILDELLAVIRAADMTPDTSVAQLASAIIALTERAATSGVTKGSFWFGKTTAGYSVPAPTAAGQTYIDFTTLNTYVSNDGESWTQSGTFVPPEGIDFKILITSKFWDITEQTGQQGGEAIYNHTDDAWTYWPKIISFNNAGLTGISTCPTPTDDAPGNQIANKDYVDNHFVSAVLNVMYPVGALYFGTQDECPMGTLMPDTTWELVAMGKALWGGNGTSGSGTTPNANYANAAANTTIAAGAPNMTGDVGAFQMTSVADKCTGAFVYKNFGQSSYGGGGSQEGARGANLNASRSSSIYGNSTTVQPPAYVVNVWRRTA